MDKDEKIFAALSHFSIIFQLTGIVVTVIIYALKGKESSFINLACKQALGWQVLALLVGKIIAFLTFGSFFGGIHMGFHPFSSIFGMISLASLSHLFFVVLGIIGAIKSLNGEKYKYPLMGDFLENI